jgi:hypothetical protein
MMGAFYTLFCPAQAVGANTVHWDLFNAAGSASDLYVHEVVPVVSGSTAVTGVVGIDVFLTRTTAVGTGGTAATKEGSSLTAATISSQSGSAQLDNNVTARITPTGGGTAGAVLSSSSLFGEETNSAAYNAYANMARVPGIPEVPPVKVPEGTGLRAVQGSVASAGNVGWIVTFEVTKK